MRQCDVCRKKMSPDALFCPHCGEPYGMKANLESLIDGLNDVREAMALLYKLNLFATSRQSGLAKDPEFQELSEALNRLISPVAHVAPGAKEQQPTPPSPAEEKPGPIKAKEPETSVIEAEKIQAAKTKEEKPSKKQPPKQEVREEVVFERAGRPTEIIDAIQPEAQAVEPPDRREKDEKQKAPQPDKSPKPPRKAEAAKPKNDDEEEEIDLSDL